MINILLTSMILIFLMQFTISGYITAKIFILYRDISSMQLLTVVGLSNITIITSLIYYNADFLSGNTGTLSFKIALFTILLLIVIISLMLDKAIYSYKVRLLSKISFFSLSIVIGIILSEFIDGQNNFFYLKEILGHFIPYYALEPSILIIIGGLAILGSIYLSYKDLVHISHALVSKNSFYLMFASSATIFIAFMMNLILQTFSSKSLVNTPLFNKDFIYFLHFSCLNLLSFSFAYFSYTQPFLNLTGGVRPNLLLDRGLVGYFLAYHTDNGPEPLAYSKQFVKIANVSFESLLGLAVSSIILVGSYDEKQGKLISKVSIIPIPNINQYSALTFTFGTKSENINDPRFKNNTPTVFAILFPSAMTIAIRGINETLKNVLDYVIKFNKIEDFQKEQILSSLATTILRKIFA